MIFHHVLLLHKNSRNKKKLKHTCKKVVLITPLIYNNQIVVKVFLLSHSHRVLVPFPIAQLVVY